MAEKAPAISVILPTYNREHLISRAISSVLAQTHSELELIVVDDGSTDNTREVVANFDDPRINYIRYEQNAGVCAARNTGLEASKGQYIAFIDSDDEWLPEKLHKQLKLFQESKSSIGVIYTWLNVIDDSGKTKYARTPKQRGIIFGNLLFSNFIGTPSTVIAKRECFRDIKFDSRLRCGEDWDVWLQIAQTYEYDFIPETLVKYRDHNDKNRGSTNSKAIIEGYLLFLKKHHIDIRTTYQALGSFSNRKKANYLFNIGKRLICHGTKITHPEAVKVGRLYLSLARTANPFSIRLLINYTVSLFGGKAYIRMINTENRVKGLISYLFGKSPYPQSISASPQEAS